MNEQRAQFSLAGRVRNGIRNAFQYNKDFEVASKFPNVKENSNIFNLLNEIRISLVNFEGIVLRYGQLVDFILKKNCALTLAKTLKANDKVHSM